MFGILIFYSLLFYDLGKQHIVKAKCHSIIAIQEKRLL